jgi:trehalose 6-phosphate phosphatase
MCWVSLDRAGKIAERFLGRQRPDYLEAAEIIKAQVLEQGWNEEIGAFTASYGSQQLDAAVLLMGLTGLIDPTDPRFAKTVDAIEAGLRTGATVYRYRYDDGLPGTEGGFHICATWLVEAYALVGRTDDAYSLLDDIAKLAGPTGLYSEQHDPASGSALGNHPQAYSHLGLIEAALRLEGLGQRYSAASASSD